VDEQDDTQVWRDADEKENTSRGKHIETAWYILVEAYHEVVGRSSHVRLNKRIEFGLR